MDSRLMNVLHNEPFDNNFNKYEYDDTHEFYTEDTMNIQLTETLDGILPIALPTVTLNSLDAYESVTHKYDTTMQQNNQKVDLLVYDRDDTLQQQQSNKRTFDIITIDANEHSNFDDLIEYDSQTQSSQGTFRTRTDSSSIADYESHSSDYEYEDLEDQEEQEEQTENQATDLECWLNNIQGPVPLSNGLIEPDELVLAANLDFPFINNGVVDSGITFARDNKQRTISTNTISSDIEELGLNIDARDFDLAEFITKDDIKFPNQVQDTTKAITKITTTNNVSLSVAKLPKLQEEASTSKAPLLVAANVVKVEPEEEENDVFVDVESLEIEEQHDIELTEHKQVDSVYEDNIKNDPNWQPVKTTKTAGAAKKDAKSATTTTHSKAKQANATATAATSSVSAAKNKIVNKKSEKIMLPKTNNGNGTGTLLKDANHNAVKMQPLEQKQTKQQQQQQIQEKQPQVSVAAKVKKQKSPIKAPIVVQPVAPTVFKRKLNLEEYKQRRSNNSNNSIEYKPIPPQSSMHSTQPNITVTAPKPTTTIKHSEAVTAIVKSLKEETVQNTKPATDPITIAKNKVLRMQQLKRAQQMKILDNTLASKVPRVTKLLPLMEMFKPGYEQAQHNIAAKATKSDNTDNFRAIVLVSTGTNTDVSIAPHKQFGGDNLLNQSNTLLSNIANTMQKVKSIGSVPVMQNSLIASIQDVVVKKVISPVTIKSDAASAAIEHGENKIIMHVPRNYVQRCVTTNCATQTNLSAEFPLLPAPKLFRTMRKSRERHMRKRCHDESAMLSNDSDNNYNNSPQRASDSVSRFSNHSQELDAINAATNGACIGSGGEYSSRSSRSRHHRSSISSSYSENEGYAQGRRQRRRSYRARARNYARASSASSSEDDNYSRRSKSRSRTRSRSPYYHRKERNYHNRKHNDHNVAQPAVEERRIVYVGRIEQETSKEMLKQKFLPYGNIKTITIHYKETGMKYGFVTYERSEDAFAVIDNSNRDSQINMYDISFGGRRAFCRASYADLDNAGINTYHSFVFPTPAPAPKQEDSFEAMLQQVKAKLMASKQPSATTTAALKTESVEENKESAVDRDVTASLKSHI